MWYRLRVGSAMGAALLAALILPAVASAHVGRIAPVATNYEARITRLPPAGSIAGVSVVDGDLEMWLSAIPAAVITVEGIEGEQLLLFDSRGVFVNVHSLTAASDRIDSRYLQPLTDPRAPPVWRRLTTGHTYMWHEHRLHALQPLSRGRGSGVLGRWSVPLRTDGVSHAVSGILVYSAPDPVWLWLALLSVVALAATGAVAHWQSPLAPYAVICTAVVATASVWTVRVGRELYGRPTVGVIGFVEIALTCVVGVALLYGLWRSRTDGLVVMAVIIAIGSLYEGLTMLPVLTRAVALSALPSTFVRVAVVAMLGLGGGLLAWGLRAPVSEARRRPADAQPGEPVGGAA